MQFIDKLARCAFQGRWPPALCSDLLDGTCTSSYIGAITLGSRARYDKKLHRF
jgi:hypothetical protein